jgi:hypothetical protein
VNATDVQLIERRMAKQTDHRRHFDIELQVLSRALSPAQINACSLTQTSAIPLRTLTTITSTLMIFRQQTLLLLCFEQ